MKRDFSKQEIQMNKEHLKNVQHPKQLRKYKFTMLRDYILPSEKD